MANETQTHEMMLEMNEALVLGALRQHELAAAAEASNALLKVEIMERKLAEEALTRAQVQLANRAMQLEGLVAERTTELTATNKQLETFVYSIAHDLRAPLRHMQGFSSLLVEKAGAILDQEGKDFAHRINTSAQFMDAMLMDLLTFCRTSHQRAELSPVSLEAVVDSVLSRCGQEIQEKNARVECTGPWPMVLAHERTLAQVLFNLVGNALKFVTKNVPPVVCLSMEERSGFIRVWVEDNGPGIAPAYQTQIFNLFTRLEGTKFAGTGVGLAIVQKGVERMGGKVGVESSLGYGSRFWFELQKG